MKFDLGFRVGQLLTMKDGLGDVAKDYFVGVKGNQITEVAPFQDRWVKECVKFKDASTQLMIPGLINGHTHLAMSLLRGFKDDVVFQDWLFKNIIPFETAHVNEEFVKLGVELSALECIRFGTTTINDIYFYPWVTAKVVDEAGLRGYVAQHYSDMGMHDEKNFTQAELANLDETRVKRFMQFVREYKDHPRVMPALGPHAPYTNSDELMRFMKRLAEESGALIHMHVSETRLEVEDSLKKYGKTPVKRLYDLGLFDHPFVIAHGVHLSDDDIKILSQTGTSIAYNPDSNAKLSSGVAKVPQYRKSGIPMAIGTDGAASNNDLSLFGAMDLGTKLQKLTGGSNLSMTALDALNLATYEGAKALRLQDRVGSIESGKRADLVLLSLDEPHLLPLHSVLSQLVYSFQGLEVNSVWCDGRALMEDRQFKTLDKKAIYARVQSFFSSLTP